MPHATTTRLRSATPVFLVADIAATMRWYQEALGFEVDAVPPHPPHAFCILCKDDVVIFLQQLAGYRKPDLYDEREGGVWSAYLRTDGVRGLYEALKERADVTVLQPLHRQPYGQTEFEIRDPNGYALVFAEPG
ncbi:MAG: VOC family protein [Gemmatimonadales bacterium]